jgi:KTSC domain
VQHLRLDERVQLKLTLEQICNLAVSSSMPFVQSSALEQVSYDDLTQTLCATFRNTGRTFIYEEVPQEIYDSLLFADSLGAYFENHIRDRFPFREI